MDKTAGAGYGILMNLLGEHDLRKVLQRLDDDQQSSDLMYKSVRLLASKFDLDGQEEAALNRLANMVKDGQRWDPALLRNNVFKIANLLGISLPSGMFASQQGVPSMNSLYRQIQRVASQHSELRHLLAPVLRKYAALSPKQMETALALLERTHPGLTWAVTGDGMQVQFSWRTKVFATLRKQGMYLLKTLPVQGKPEDTSITPPTVANLVDVVEMALEDYQKGRTRAYRPLTQGPSTQVMMEPEMGVTAGAEDEMLGGRTWGAPDPRAKPDDATPYNKHEDSPPAGADGSAERKKYNEWYRKNVCPTHKTNCGAPWLAKSAGRMPGPWVEKQDPHRWLWTSRDPEHKLAFTVYERPGPGIPIYVLRVLMPDGKIFGHKMPYQWKDPKQAMAVAAQWYAIFTNESAIGIDMTHNWEVPRTRLSSKSARR